MILLSLLGCQSQKAVKEGRETLITINPRQRYQRMEGFGASGSWTIDPVGEHWSPEQRKRLAELLFDTEKGIGLSIWKFNAGATGVESSGAFFSSPFNWRKADSFRPDQARPYNWTAHIGQQRFLQLAMDHGVENFQLIFYSPPSWMTENRLTHPDSESGTTNLLPEREGDYVQYMADILEQLQHAFELEFSHIVPLNEPHWAWNDSIQEANRYAVREIKRIVQSLSRELAHRGLTPAIVVPEAGELMALLDDESFSEYWMGFKRRYNSQNLELTTDGKYREYLKELLGDPEIRALIGDRISAHSYWSDDKDPPDDRLVKLRRMVRRDLDNYAPGAVYLQTEYCILGDRGPGRDLSMDSAIHVAEVLQRDLTLMNAAEWSWWLALSPHDYKDGLLYTDWRRPGDTENILPSKIFYVLGQFSRFIRPGFTRVEASVDDTDSSVIPSAFVDEHSGTQVVVLVNTGEETAVRLRTASQDRYRVYRTSAKADENIHLVGEYLSGESLWLPAESVTTLESN